MAKKATTKKAAVVPEVLEAEAPEVALVLTESAGVLTWLEGLAAFFKTARAIETDAIATRDRVLKLPVPTTKEEDAAMRQEALAARDKRKGALAHWDPITSVLSKLHKRATSGRSRATDPLEEAEKFATRQHDTFERNEQRRAAEEQERIRREEERKATEARERTLAEFEAAALAAEESSPDLSAREEKFVMLHSGLNADGTRGAAPAAAMLAAGAAGYKNPAEMAPRLIASDKIRAAIAARQSAHTMRTQIAVMREMPPAIDEQLVEAAAPQLNSGDSHTWTAVCLDEQALRDAAFEQPALGIPRDLFVLDEAALNRYARSMEKQIERWPGVKATRKTTIRR